MSACQYIISGHGPSELEILGGKAKSKNWKRSICLDGKPLLYCFVHLGLSDPGRACSSILEARRICFDHREACNNILVDRRVRFDHRKACRKLAEVWRVRSDHWKRVGGL